MEDTRFYFPYYDEPTPEPVNSTGWKGGNPTPEEYEEAMKELYPDI